MHDFMTILKPYFEVYGYWAIAAAVLPAGFGIPTPAETALIVAVLLASRGEMSLVAVLATALCATLVGNSIGYYLGYYGGRPLCLRYGKYLFVTEERLGRMEVFFRKYGGIVLLVARFLDVFRQLNGIVAGIAHMPLFKFQLYNAAGGLLWVGFWGIIIYVFGHRIKDLHSTFVVVEFTLLAAVFTASMLFVIRMLRARKP
jgi:membrane protein DedA with SNARE-associated domain